MQDVKVLYIRAFNRYNQFGKLPKYVKRSGEVQLRHARGNTTLK